MLLLPANEPSAAVWVTTRCSVAKNWPPVHFSNARPTAVEQIVNNEATHKMKGIGRGAVPFTRTVSGMMGAGNQSPSVAESPVGR